MAFTGSQIRGPEKKLEPAHYLTKEMMGARRFLIDTDNSEPLRVAFLRLASLDLWVRSLQSPFVLNRTRSS